MPKPVHQNKAIQSSLQQPLCLIQGPPGTGKTATAAAIVYNFVMRKKRYEELEALDGKARRDLERQCEISILKNAQVVCCTCVGAGDRKLFSCRFQMILVDECGQATEPECMIPIVFHGRDKVILIGDHCQLGPVVMDEAAVRHVPDHVHSMAGLRTSLFERLVTLGIKPVQLTTQYRMHPALSKFPSQEFYSNELKDGVKSLDRMADTISSFGNVYITCISDEAQCVGKVIEMLLDANVDVESQIGVITPYNEQRKAIKWWLPKSSNKKVN
ncbi:hypothetical protein EMCRGX_G004889 [Ephydatia muelleri]